MSDQRTNQGIAIVGMGGRFPRAENLHDFWVLLAGGQATFEPIPPDRTARHAVADLEGMTGTFLNNPFLFDNQHFKIPESEALYLDPQQRIMLELAVQTMEDGGYASLANQAVGVFIGANQMAYEEMLTSRWYRQKALTYLTSLEAFQQLPDLLRNQIQSEMESLSVHEALPQHALVGNLTNMIAGRIAHELNLKGPALTMDTACSSSLVAVHLACQALRNRECDLAFAGGINLNLSPSIFRYMKAAGVISPTGKCVPFSQNSDGILLGEGAGLVLLKRLEDAIRDRDPIWAVIRGTGINNDGRSLSIMAPGWKGQLALLETTYSLAGFDPGRIAALEAHGTSTRIGDAVELSVIERFFPRTPENQIAIGSVKSNIGHTLGAAGIAGLIKMALALHHRQLPPSLHGTIDPNRDLDAKGIHIQSHLADWECAGLRAAGVSSFGFGGTNAHLILEEHTEQFLERPAPRTVFQHQYFNFDFFPQLKPTSETWYKLEWDPVATAETASEIPPGQWLILSHDAAELKHLAAYWASKNHPCFQVLFHENPHFVRQSEYLFNINPQTAEHFRWLINSLPIGQEAGILLLGREHFASPDLKMFRQLLQVVRQRGQIKLWVATRDGFQVAAGDPIHPDQRALAVLAIGALSENEHLRGGVIDWSGQSLNPEILLRCLSTQPEQPLVIRDHQIFQPRLAKAEGLPATKLKPGGVYLIVGGSSGIGAEMAAYLIQQGADKVLITGTRSEAALPESLRVLSAKLEYRSCSVLDRPALQQLITEWCERFPEINGVVFAAGVLQYGALTSKSDAAFELTLRTKIEGVQNLHNALQGKVVKTVYLMSSVAALTPEWAKGMADYAAANAYLVAFAAAQAPEPTRWVACSWGIWENTGMATRVQTNSARTLPLEQALHMFETTMALGQGHPIVLPESEKALFSFNFPVKSPNRQPEPKPEASRQPVPEPAPEPESQKPTSTDYTAMLRRFIAAAIEKPEAEIDEKTSFYQIGLDSLSAVDVVFKIEKATGFSLDPTLLFEHDTIEALGAYLQQRSGGTAQPPAPEDELTDTLLLLPAQKTFFAQQMMFPDAPCNMLVTAEFDQPLQVERLQQVWNCLINQNEALRMAYAMTDEGPRQRLQANVSSPIEQRRVSQRADAQRFEDELVNDIFDLEHPPLFRLMYVETEQGQSSLLLLLHHLVADAWSMHVLLESLLAAYQDLPGAAGDAPCKPGISFRLYEKHVQAKSAHKKRSEQQAFWTEELANARIGIPLPYRQDSLGTGRYQAVRSHLSPEVTAQVLDSARRWQVTSFHILLAAYFLTLRKHSRQSDLIARVAVANRDQSFPGMEALVGCLADSIPLRVELDETDQLEQVALQVKKRMLAALRHSDLSAQEFAALPIQRDGNSPLVLSPAGISFLPMDYLAKDTGLSLTSVRGRSALNFTDLSLICSLAAGQLWFSWNFSDQKFAPETIAGINDSFIHILTTGWGGPECLHERVWAACRLHPDRIAIVSGDEQVDYRNLHEDSVRIANTLTQLNPDLETAGILAYPGVQAVKGILGILGTGLAFIPFDPDWPDGRMETMVNHAGLKVMLTDAVQLPRLLKNQALMASLEFVVVLDDLPESQDGPPGKVVWVNWQQTAVLLPPLRATTADCLAYVMYTSGTSGKPKGVMVRHRAVKAFLDWVAEAFQVDSDCRFIHTSSLGFGGSIRQIFSTLLAGGIIFPIARPALKDPQLLLEFLVKNRITMFNTVPTVLNNLLEWLAQEGVKPPPLPDLKWVLVGGETLFLETVSKWYQHFGTKATIVNLYGSTETIVNATAFPLIPGSFLPAGAAPLGKEKKGSVVRLLNTQGAICKPGETGELYVGGPCLAAGYYKEPALTGEKFVRLPQLGLDGVFYCTGDLARVDSDGNLHFSGRNDDQIQVYGNRVEPIEIEDVLYQTHQVKNAAIVDHQEGAVHWLVAFVELLKLENQPTDKQLRDWIAARLPAYMVPHQVRILDKMPLNHAGKTDRSALRSLLGAKQHHRPGQEAWTATETTLAEVWKKVLRNAEVQREDDFFELGGDSILLLEVLFQLRKHFNQVPKAATMFRERKLRALAAELDRLNSLVAAENNSDADASVALPTLSPAQKGFILIRDLHPDWSPNWSAMLKLSGELDLPAMTQAFEVMLQRHEMLRTVFVGRGGQAVPQVTPVTPQQLDFKDISGLTPEAQAAFLEQAFSTLKSTQFDLAQFPLFKLTWYQTAPRQLVLAICLHHIVGDAWSMQILFDELLQAYDLCRKGRAPDLGPPPPPYRSAVAYWLSQASTMDTARLKKLQSFWSETLSALPASAMPPADAVHVDNEQISVLLSESDKGRLLKLSREQGVSLFNTLLTLFARALKNTTQASDVLVGTAVSGRDIPIGRVQKMVGCFARNLPVRIKLPQGTTLAGDIQNVTAAFLNAFEHQDIPPNELFKLISQSGNNSIFSINRYYFSFMDFSTIGHYQGEYLNILWDQSDYYFNSGAAGAELMLGVSVGDQIRVQLHGYAPGATKARLLELFQAEIQALSDPSNNLDVALIAYLPGASWLRRLLRPALQNGVIELAKQRLFPDRRSRLVERTVTPLGAGGLVMLPADADALQALTFPVLTRQVTDAVEVAVRNGARIISLAGVLPANTNYGFAVMQALQQQPWYHPGIKLSTGHSCTVVAVVKTIEKVLAACAVDIRDLKVAVVGFGSIGQSSLMLLLRALGSPASLVVADLAEQLPRLEKPLEALRDAYAGPVQVCPVRQGTVPEEVYQADLVIGASSSGSVLEVGRFKPGAILVDDSFPPVVDQATAVERMKNRRDVLFLGGGKLSLGVQQLALLVPEIPASMLEAVLASTGNEGMPGCRVEPFVLLSSPELPPTLGLASPALIWQYWEKIQELGITAVRMHLGGFLVPEGLVKEVGALLSSNFNHKNQATEPTV